VKLSSPASFARLTKTPPVARRRFAFVRIRLCSSFLARFSSRWFVFYPRSGTLPPRAAHQYDLRPQGAEQAALARSWRPPIRLSQQQGAQQAAEPP